MSDFSERLTSLREDKGWNKTYTVKQIGLKSMQTYANWEYGRTEPDFEMLSKIASVFGVSTDYLLEGKKSSSNNKTADLDDDDVIFTYQGKPLSDEDKALIKRLMNGKD